MALPTYTTGTVSINDGDLVIVGSGAIWSSVNAKAGDLISIDDTQPVVIKDVIDTGQLALWAPWAGGAKVSVSYILIQNYPSRVVGVGAAEDVGTMLAKLKTGGLPFLVEMPETEPDPSLGADGQYAVEPISGEQWLKTGGAWVSQGIFRAFGVAAPWSAVTDYEVNNVATDLGASYICILPNTNQRPPNATYWAVLAAKGDSGATGPAAWSVPAAWLTATDYVAGPPASVVVEGGETYICPVSHTSGTFATDLAAGKWIKVAQKGTNGTNGTDGTNGSNGTNGAGYGGTSTTSLAIATGNKAFATQAGLAYPASGGYVRASSAANGANYMEGLATYSGTTLTIAVTAIGGSGTKADWNFSVAGSPGVGDMLKSDNLSGLASVATAQTNLGAVAYANSQSLTTGQQDQGRSNLAIPGSNKIINGGFTINQRSYASAAALASGSYGHDRWKSGASGGNYSFTQLASSTTITIAASKSLIQIVEDKNVEGGSYVLSWTGTAQARYGVNTTTPSGSYASSPILITGQTAGTTMSVEFNTGTLGQVKLELGTTPTPFVMPDIDIETRRCRRYYWRVRGGTGGTANIALLGRSYTGSPGLTIFFTAPMRVAPTATRVGTWTLAGSAAQPNFEVVTPDYATMFQVSPSAGDNYFYASGASVGADFDAEL